MDESSNTDLLQQILQELQTLNQNFSDYRVYIEDRNTRFDEKIAQEEQVKADAEAKSAEEAKQAEEQKQAEEMEKQAEEPDPYMDKLTVISDTLTDFKSESLSRQDTVSSTSENIEYNTSYMFTVQCILLGVLTLVAGFLFAKSALRKL